MLSFIRGCSIWNIVLMWTWVSLTHPYLHSTWLITHTFVFKDSSLGWSLWLQQIEMGYCSHYHQPPNIITRKNVGTRLQPTLYPLSVWSWNERYWIVNQDLETETFQHPGTSLIYSEHIFIEKLICAQNYVRHWGYRRELSLEGRSHVKCSSHNKIKNVNK